MCSYVVDNYAGSHKYDLFSDKGIVYSARAYKIPECTRNAAGTPLVQVLPCSLIAYHAVIFVHLVFLVNRSYLVVIFVVVNRFFLCLMVRG